MFPSYHAPVTRPSFRDLAPVGAPTQGGSAGVNDWLGGTDAEIARLRDLHAAMDRAILTCYGWTDLDPAHGFHQNERGQTRYTISPTARRELLRRLLELNSKITAQEASIV